MWTLLHRGLNCDIFTCSNWAPAWSHNVSTNMFCLRWQLARGSGSRTSAWVKRPHLSQLAHSVNAACPFGARCGTKTLTFITFTAGEPTHFWFHSLSHPKWGSFFSVAPPAPHLLTRPLSFCNANTTQGNATQHSTTQNKKTTGLNIVEGTWREHGWNMAGIRRDRRTDGQTDDYTVSNRTLGSKY